MKLTVTDSEIRELLSRYINKKFTATVKPEQLTLVSDADSSVSAHVENIQDYLSPAPAAGSAG